MATLEQQIKAEQSGRAMLKEAGLPQPDAVEYGYTCIRFFWNHPKLALVIEIDKPPEGFEVAGDYVSDMEEVGNYLSDTDEDAA